MEGIPNLKRQEKENKETDAIAQEGDMTGEKGGVSKEKAAEVYANPQIIEDKIRSLKENKGGWFKRAFRDDEETIRRLNAGFAKIKSFPDFANDFNEAFKQGGEKFALEYAEAIGNGELVKPINGVLMVSGKRSQDSFGGFNN